MCQKIIFIEATPRALGPVIHFADFAEKKNFLTKEPILTLRVSLDRAY